MTAQPYRVGIVGLQPGRSWAARAHLPALRSLVDVFTLAGVANSSPESARDAADAAGIGIAFDSTAELVASPDIDIVAVTTRVQHHFAIAKAALEAGKHVYCEWPLALDVGQAEELAAIARQRGVLGVVGTQARVAPEIAHLKKLVRDGYVGEVLSTSILAYGGGWGGTVTDKKNSAYLLDATSGATMLTIPVGHTLAAVTAVLGEFLEVSSVLETRRKTARVAGTDEQIPVTAPDQVLVAGRLEDGATMSIHYRGGMPRDGQGFLWEINGTEGDLRVSAPFGHAQLVRLQVSGIRGVETAYTPLDIPGAAIPGLAEDPGIRNLALNYRKMAEDLLGQTRTAPSFDDAVGLHKLIEAIERASSQGGSAAI